MINTISMAEKPTPHISEPDWKAKIWNMKAVAETRKSDAFNLRYDVRQARNEAVITRRWANYHNNVRISDRLTEIRRWLNKVGGSLQNLRHQSELLMQEKFDTEKDIEKYSGCLNTLAECRLLLDTKNKLNLVDSQVEVEIKSEVNCLESMKKFLSQKCFSAWEENNRLVELIFKLENDVADKTTTVDIDLEALKLDSSSSSATYKPDVLQLASTFPLETWAAKAECNQIAADNESETAERLRDSMVLGREKCKMDYLAQYEATNFALRRRIYETVRLKTEMEFQKNSILDEMDKLCKELDKISNCKEETVNYLKCAETRLEMRNQRPPAEATRDEAQIGLFEEILLLRDNLDEMDRKIGQTKYTYNQMENYLLEIETEIKYQTQSIKLDTEALEIHDRLIKMIEISQIDKNIELLNMQKVMPPERPVVR